MRQKIVAGNWKMNLAYAQAMALSDAIADGLRDTGSCEVVLAPPFVYLHDVLRRVGHRDRISIAAQNCSAAESGAFTGEVSAAMLASIGIEFTLIGHSERRTVFGETDDTIAVKVRQALRHGITPVFCCGETLAERESGVHIEMVERQLMTGLLTLEQKDLSQCIIAYEPVWAIGTGRTATPEQAQDMHACIRSAVAKTAPDVSESISILYGGSVNSANAATLFSAPDVDGALVGGASLKADEFLAIVEHCS